MQAIQENQECALNFIMVGINKIRLPNGRYALAGDYRCNTHLKQMEYD